MGTETEAGVKIRRKTAFVFQNYNLFRNKTALQNVTEGLVIARKMPRSQAEKAGKRDKGVVVEENTPKEFFESPKEDRARQFMSSIKWSG